MKGIPAQLGGPFYTILTLGRDIFSPKSTRAELGEIICQKSGSPNYKKFGVRHNKDSGHIQRDLCKDCEYRFIVNPAFENSKASAKIITAAIDLYFKGVSTRKIAEHLKQLYNFSIDDSSICRCIRKFTRLVQPYVDGLVPKTGGVYHVDEMLLHLEEKITNRR